jgi:hypothetical protein
MGESSSIRGIRVIRGSILLLATVVCSLAFSSLALADASEASRLANPFGVDLDSLDCLTACEIEEEPALVCDNSPNPWNDRDQLSLPLNDKAVLPSRCDQETPQTTSTTLDPIVLRRPGIIPAFLFPTHSSDSLHEHIRERAPPSLA